MSKLEELHVAVLRILLEREGSFCGTTACNDSFGDASSILAMPSIIEPWLCAGAIDGSAVLLSHASCYSEYP